MSSNDTLKKHRRKSISLETKIKILDCLANRQRSCAVSRRFNINESTIRTIKKNEAGIREAVVRGTNLSAKSSSYAKGVVKEKMEKALLMWIEDNAQKKIKLDGNIIRKKALRLYHLIQEQEPSTSQSTNGKREFTASSGWFFKFIKRYSLHNVKVRGESASADATTAAAFPAKLAKIIEEGGYSAHQVFNVDECGLFWKKMPSRTFIAKAEKSGFKAKDRVTLLFCSNASGDRILKPLLINRSLKLRLLKRENLSQLPVHWMANKEAWITEASFKEWFEKCFVPEVKTYLEEIGLDFNIILILDNAPGHPDLNHPNVKTLFLPPYTSSLTQPLEQGIIATFKRHYIKQTFRYILEKIKTNEYLTVMDAWKSFSIRECVKRIGLALSEIKQSTLNVCWEALWPECVEYGDPVPSDTDLYSEIILLAHAIGGEGFRDLEPKDIDELLTEQAFDDEELIETLQESSSTEESSHNKSSTNFTVSVIRKGLQLAEELSNYFVENDPHIERAMLFKNYLKYCMARYKELYKKLTENVPQNISVESLEDTSNDEIES